MQAAGVPDSEADAVKHFDAVVGDVGPASSPERRRAYVENAPRMVAFLQEQGIPFRHSDGYSDYYSDAPGGNPRGRTHRGVALRYAPSSDRGRRSCGPVRPPGLGLVGSSTELTKMSYYNRGLKNTLIGARVLARTYAGKLRRQVLVANGGALVGRMLHAALERGAQVWTEAPVTNLIVEDGAVVGAVVRKDGKDQRVAARRGVLLGGRRLLAQRRDARRTTAARR